MEQVESPAWPVQVAIYQRLSNALSVPVFDHVPDGTEHPYVVVGEMTETPSNEHSRFGARLTCTVHVWSRQRGWNEAKAIAAAVRRALDHQVLPVDGHTWIACRHEQSVTVRDPDPEIRHIPVRFAVDTEQEESS